ncbi:MAG: helix-turn-helix domain containing protein [Rhodobacterales bacterium 32-67-9]|nr:MAG: helix-turn-helix domain containing protein [Rhodobacterales bacterium 32-67-9]
MTVLAQMPAALPAWLPENARLYLRHIEEGLSIRALARSEGCHASTVLRKVRAFENRRDDPLIDDALNRLGRLHLRLIGTDRAQQIPPKPVTEEGPSPMTAPIRSPHMQIADEATVVREARRILRRLCEIGAMLAVSPEMEKAVVLKGTVRTAVVDRTVAQAFALKDWIAVQKAGRVTTYEITGAGRAALKRLLAEDHDARSAGFAEAQTPFGDQHRVWDERTVMEPGSRAPRRMRYNLAESPLAVLARRKEKDGSPFLDSDLVAAGERLREDFELAQMGPRVAQNWDRFLTAGDRGNFAAEGGAGGGSGRARDRVAAALRDLGPGLGDMVLRCCCFLEGLEVAEKRMGWSARSGKIVLRIALQRLKRHYDETYGGKAPLIG